MMHCTETNEGKSNQRKSILVVEDSVLQREVLTRTLESAGYQVIEAANGKIGMEQAGEYMPDVIISDINMPEMDGYQLCAGIKSNEALKHIPVLLLTILSNPFEIIEGLNAGAQGYITKPYSTRFLLDKVKSVTHIKDEEYLEEIDEGIEYQHNGKYHLLSSSRKRILEFLLSVSGSAIQQNRELIEAQAAQKSLNKQLEKKIAELNLAEAEIKSAHEQMQEYSTMLEKKVEERTQELSQANDELMRLDQAKTEFLNVASHELRTPLTSVLGFAKIILRNFKKAQLIKEQEGLTGRLDMVMMVIANAMDNIGIITSEAERLTSIINNLLDISKMESAKYDWNMQLNDMGMIVRQVASVSSALFNEKDVELRVEIDDQLPAIYCDRDRIIQVLINLVSNAVKFTDQGTVIINMREENENLVVVVNDSGIGIPEDEIDHIFTRFKQVSYHNEDKPRGSGLGLAIAKEIVEQHQGVITVESKVGQGTVFQFSLPLNPIIKELA